MKELPKKGAWVLVTKTIPVKNVFAPLYSIWYALPSGEFSIGDEDRVNSEVEREIEFPFRDLKTLKYFIKLYKADKTALKGLELKEIKRTLDKWPINHQAKILTPFGSVLLQHNEYNIINFNDYLESVDNGSFQVKFLNTTKASKNKVRDQLFYIRSRGISISTALGMVSGLVRSQNTYYMLAHPEYQKAFLRYYDRYAAEQLVFKRKQIKKNSECEQYFFNEEEALKLNQQHYKNLSA